VAPARSLDHAALGATIADAARWGIARVAARRVEGNRTHAITVQLSTLPNFFSAAARALPSSLYSIQRVVTASV
jgi:hypothetical protein